MNTKLIFTNIFTFFIFSGLYLFSTSTEKNDIEKFPVGYDVYGINQYGLDRQSMDFIDKGYFKNINRKELENLIKNEENIPKLKLIANAYQFHDIYLLGFIRTKQECEFEGNNSINCQLYLTDQDFNDFKYKTDLYCDSDNGCQLTNFELLSTSAIESEKKYYCNENFLFDSNTGMCISHSEYMEVIVNDLIKKFEE